MKTPILLAILIFAGLTACHRNEENNNPKASEGQKSGSGAPLTKPGGTELGTRSTNPHPSAGE